MSNRYTNFAAVVILLIAAFILGNYFGDRPKVDQQPVLNSPSINSPPFNQNPPKETPAQYKDLVRMTSPLPNQAINTPLTIKGEARGTWFFEASFPVTLLDGNNQVLARGIAQAEGEWMTENYVPFTATMTFAVPPTPTGTLVLEKDNASGLPEFADEFRIPIKFGN